MYQDFTCKNTYNYILRSIVGNEEKEQRAIASKIEIAAYMFLTVPTSVPMKRGVFVRTLTVSQHGIHDTVQTRITSTKTPFFFFSRVHRGEERGGKGTTTHQMTPESKGGISRLL